MELWDAYLPDGRKADQTLVRGEPIPDGLCHLVVTVLVKHTDGTYLVMQRDWNKEYFPGKLEPDAGGAALKGETPDAAVRRELAEETGVPAESLTFLYAAYDLKDTFFYHYLPRTDCIKNSITLQVGETIAYQWMEAEPFYRMPYLAQIRTF